MNVSRKLLLTALLAASLEIGIPCAQAQGQEEKIRVKFSGPVEIPGLVLPAGTYVFQALENERATRILSADEQHVYATLLTVPVERTESTEESTVVLGERRKNASENLPVNIQEWFYPGDSIGSEFIYSKGRSSKDVASIAVSSRREVSRGAARSAKDVGMSVEFVAVRADHIVASSVGHALKALI